VCEGLGFESGVGKKFREAPVFYWLYTILIIAGAGITLRIPDGLLTKVSILSQVINGAVLPLVLVFMLLLINKRELMGRYVNSRFFNVVAWATTVILVALTAAYLWTQRAG
jgi:Mn2+/Fe2+ NRAMP family transporter